MLLKKNLVTCLLLLPCLCMAQPDRRAYTIVKLNIAAPFDVFTFPTLQVAVEQKLYKKWSIEAEFGYQLYNLVPTDTNFIDP